MTEAWLEIKSLKLGEPARREDGALGVVCYGPDYNIEVKLLFEDGTTTRGIKLATLARPSAAELTASPWLTQVLGDDTGW